MAFAQLICKSYMNWIDIVDTSVKIGLGALIAGVFGYSKAKLDHEADRRARYSERRRNHLEQIFELLSKVESAYRIHKWKFESYLFYLNEGKSNKLEEELNFFREAEDRLALELDNFGLASSRLLLIGDNNSDELLWKYHQQVSDWKKYSVFDSSKFTDENKNKLIDSIRATRENLFASLAQSYQES